MKKYFLLLISGLTAISCAQEDFNPENPDVNVFVQQIKNGTFNIHEQSENGEKLWLVMPDFTAEHVEILLSYAMDTTAITKFPANPSSSHSLYPEGRDYLILGECLLWIVEGIRLNSKFGSLHPYLINEDLSSSEQYNGLSGQEVQNVSSLYQSWWNEYKDQNWQQVNPLANSQYAW